jgi:hypothetical protein
MHGITISDSTDGQRLLTVDLIDILRLLGPSATDSEWRISGVECAGGPAGEDLHGLADQPARVPGEKLLSLATGVTQVIDGVFAGYRDGEEQPWIIIRAVDSSAFDVQSEDAEALARMKRHFRNVTEFGGVAPPPLPPPSKANPSLGPEPTQR